MSEYQWYGFVALDRPLTAREMAELRAISTRAEITPTRCWNKYQRGDLKADPARLLARYFDAHLYFANRGTHRCMLRLPAARVDERAMRPYFPRGGPATLTRVGAHVVLDLQSDTEEPEDEWWKPASLGALTPLRASLVDGDRSVAYLAWLLAVQSEEMDDDAAEPDVPAGLAVPSAPLAALAEFLRVDPDLLQAASPASRGRGVSRRAHRAGCAVAVGLWTVGDGQGSLARARPRATGGRGAARRLPGAARVDARRRAPHRRRDPCTSRAGSPAAGA